MRFKAEEGGILGVFRLTATQKGTKSLKKAGCWLCVNTPQFTPENKMRRSVKVMIISVLTFTLIVIALCLAANAGIIYKYARSVSLMVADSATLNKSKDKNETEDGLYGNFTEGEDLSEINTLEINCSYIPVNIIEGQGGTVGYELIGADESDLAYRVSGNTLELRYDGKSDYANYASLYVYMPASAPLAEHYTVYAYTNTSDVLISNVDLKTAHINTASGDILIEGSNLQTVEVQTESGDIMLLRSTGNSASFQTSSGDIILNADTSDIKAATQSGNIDYASTKLGSLAFQSASGSISLKLPLDIGFTVNIESNNAVSAERIAMSKRGSGFVYGNGKIPIYLNTGSGNITIAPNKN